MSSYEAALSDKDVVRGNMRTWRIYGAAGLLLALVALVYWPVVHFDFVWDDWRSFHDTPWLTKGNLWEHYVFRDFNDWYVYFRPVVVAFFALQDHLFDSNPGPMHAVSLGLHLANTLLVGLLAFRCSKPLPYSRSQQAGLAGLSMMIYGFHPVLIEPIAWIGCQFDLAATMFMLCGLLVGTTIRRTLPRALAVATLFFFAICSKESAISFPLLMVIFDWALLPRIEDDGTLSSTKSLLRRNWRTYLAMSIAFLCYLAFRNWALGPASLDPFKGMPNPSFISKLQEVCATYLHYLRTIIWPLPGMGPMHPIDLTPYSNVTTSSLIVDVSAIGIVLAALYLAIVRTSPIGCILLAATVSLLPVLHLVGGNFDLSLYHERYVITALASVCALLPLAIARIRVRDNSRKVAYAVAAITGFFWFSTSLIDIHLILPNWANDVTLWRWALIAYPHASQPKENLLHAYIRIHDENDARNLEDWEFNDPAPCGECMLNIAEHSIDEHDPSRAMTALEKATRSKAIANSKDSLHHYYLLLGKAFMLQGQWVNAERALNISVTMNQADPQAKLTLAEALASGGNAVDARHLGNSIIPTLPFDERGTALQSLNAAIDEGRGNAERTQKSN